MMSEKKTYWLDGIRIDGRLAYQRALLAKMKAENTEDEVVSHPELRRVIGTPLLRKLVTHRLGVYRG